MEFLGCTFKNPCAFVLYWSIIDMLDFVKDRCYYIGQYKDMCIKYRTSYGHNTK